MDFLNKYHKLSKAILISGILLIAAGVLLNQWTLAHFLSDGKIESAWKRIIIWGFDLVLIASGIILIKKRRVVSYKNILLVVLSTALSFLLAEFSFRALYPIVSPIDQLFGKPELFEPKPYVMYGGRPNYEKLNKLGYVEEAPSKTKPPDEFSIFLLGGSTVYAGNPTISKLLENTFHNNGFPNVRCYNWGIPASTSGMELARIVYEIYDYTPDLIIMYNGGNDLMINLWADPRPGFPFNYFIYENNPLLEKDVAKYPMVNLLLYESKLLRHLFPAYFIKVFTNYNQTRKNSSWGEEKWKNEIVSTYINNITKAQKISNSFNSDFVVFFQPLVYFKDILTSQEKQFISKTRLLPYITAMRTKLFDKMASNKDSLNMIDLSNMFDTCSKQIFIDDIHTLQNSKIIIAQELFKQLTITFNKTKFYKENKSEHLIYTIDK